MVSPYLMLPGAFPRDLLKRLEAEAPHVARLAEASKMWSAMATLIDTSVRELHDRKTVLRQAWDDDAARAFEDSVNEDLRTMVKWQYVITNYGLPDIPGKSVSDSVPNRIADLVEEYPKAVAAVRLQCDDYDRQVAANDGKYVDPTGHIAVIARWMEDHDNRATAVANVLRSIVDTAPEWSGPRAAVPGSAKPNAPGPAGPAAPGGTGSPGGGDVPEMADPGDVDPGDVPGTPADTPSTDTGTQATDALSAAASALQAAQGLLGGTQMPDLSTPDLSDLAADPWQSADHRLPTLAGLDAGGYGGAGGGGVGGIGGGPGGPGSTLTGPGNPIGAGAAPITSGGMPSATTGATAAGPGSMPPMYPPNSGAGGNRQAAGGIKPGNSDRPVAESRPRPRRAGTLTPGVALAGRAAAGAPKTAARRGWDRDNDSLQVLDEDLWQVDPQEEETDGQDRRRSGRAVGGREPAQGTGHARLDGQGGRARQSPRAR